MEILLKWVQQSVCVSRWNVKSHCIQIHSELCCWFEWKSLSQLSATSRPHSRAWDYLQCWRDKGCGWLTLCQIVAHLKTGMCSHLSDLIGTLSRLVSVAKGQTHWRHVCILWCLPSKPASPVLACHWAAVGALKAVWAKLDCTLRSWIWSACSLNYLHILPDAWLLMKRPCQMQPDNTMQAMTSTSKLVATKSALTFRRSSFC